ncbi:MAG: hypothetical protein ACTSV3_07865 [Candidatus Thorarchaeota archaeon]|nr:MAG: hypothetical protein DRP09_08570 [Candidatus Thorarchaeota archaeon]RLI59596.1 MAG: hypothetical protein DRO87_02440 [Candidatus Thorarchaeota archaeon]
MHAKKRQLLAMTLLVTITLLGVSVNAVNAWQSEYTSSQIAQPFTEMQPGVYVAWEWWNESGSDYNVPMEPGYYMDFGNDTFMAEYIVEDVFGNSYIITESSVYNWTSDWSFTNLFVVILLDPDASYMSYLASQGNATDLWSIYWSPEESALSGDEVFVFSSFYYSSYNSSSYYRAEYKWYDDMMQEVNPNDVIPNLKEEYFWATFMNETYEYDYQGENSWFGYDVSEMFLSDTELTRMEHYFSGMSVFNDTNENGMMDMYYMDVEYDFDDDGIVDWVSHEVNETASEFMYDFYAEIASLGDITQPHVNDDGQIEWSAQVVDIKGTLTQNLYPIGVYYDLGDPWVPPEEYIAIPVAVDSFGLDFKFGTSDDAAVLKIDQYIGDFTDPVSGEKPDEIQGLGLTLDYWSSFSSQTLLGQVPVDTYPFTFEGNETPPTTWPDYNFTITDPEDWTEWEEVPVPTLESEPAFDGLFRFAEDSEVKTTIEFGGTYVWGRDGQTYNVGTVVNPLYYYLTPLLEAAPATELAGPESSVMWSQTYYYSSCYSNWDGFSITHDPIFSVFPNAAPASMSAFITGLIQSSAIVGVIGVVALVVVLVRIRSERR